MEKQVRVNEPLPQDKGSNCQAKLSTGFYGFIVTAALVALITWVIL